MTAVNLNRVVRGPVTAVPVVAGKGVRLVADTVNNRFVVEADETVLYNASGDGRTTSFTLSEPATNFEYLRFQGVGYNNGPCLVTIPAPTGTTENISVTYLYFCANNDGNPMQIHSCRFSTTDAKTYTTIDKKFMYWPLSGVTAGSNNTSVLSITKVIGVHRIAGGN